MLHLFLVRHAKAVAIAPADKERELAQDGRVDASKIGQLFGAKFNQPEHVFCSPALRTIQTYEVMKDYGLSQDSCTYDEALYHASASHLWDIITSYEGEGRALLVIAHNPAIAILVNHLVGDDMPADLMHFPTATIAHLQIDAKEFKDFSDDSKISLNAVYRGSQL